MSTPFNHEGSSLSWAESGDVVMVVDGTSFCLSAQSGDVSPDRAQGLFHRDVRLISRWELHIDGQRLEPLSVQPSESFAGVFVGRPRAVPGQAESALSVLRERMVSEGMRERLTLRNLSDQATSVTVTLLVASDFADVFAVKHGTVRPAEPQPVTMDGRQLMIGPAEKGVLVGSRCVDPVLTPGTLTFDAAIEARGEWHVCLDARPSDRDQQPAACFEPSESSAARLRLTAWRDGIGRLRSGYPPLGVALGRTEVDLGSLRIGDPRRPDLYSLAAGAPWYLTLFGRDSLLASWMALLIDPRLAIGTVHMLADLQGERVDPRSEEEPGRIPHEVRRNFGQGDPLAGPAYYGTADATPLFVMLVGELYRWGQADAARPLLANVDSALAWIADYGDRDGDGFVEYQRATDQGLANQGWKDHEDAVSFAGGRLASPPIALCEVQAYVYGAYRVRAEIACAEGDQRNATRYADLADDLKRSFNARFWLPDRGYLAFALDRDKRPVDAATSNMGHCLWTGIVDDDKAEQVADHLLSPQLFSGWGIRTLSTEAGRYNPVSYHNGSVWPHDSAIVVAGLRRYGFTDHAQRVTTGLLDAARCFDGRLPELFCGFDRTEFSAPVGYPSSCSPQAWSAAAPLLLARALLGFEPNVPAGVLHVAAALPPELGELRVQDVPLGGSRVTVVADGDRADVTGLPSSLRLQRGR